MKAETGALGVVDGSQPEPAESLATLCCLAASPEKGTGQGMEVGGGGGGGWREGG